MKKILLLLVLAIGLFGAEPSIPSEVGSVDAFTYSEDKKTLYILKDETVTIWNVQPFKKINSFETTINHLRNYVSEDINTSYLEEVSKKKVQGISVSKKVPNRIRIASKYITEQWDANGKQMFYGGPGEFRFQDKISIDVDNRKVEYFILPHQGMHTIKMIVNDKIYYELYINPFDKHHSANSVIRFNFFYNESDWTKDIKYVITYDDGRESIHRKILSDTLKNIDATTKEPVVSQYIVTLGKRSSPEMYNDVWKSKTIEEAMKKLYGTTESIPSSNAMAVYDTAVKKFIVRTKFNTDIKSMAIFATSIEHPALAILKTHAIDAQQEIELKLYASAWAFSEMEEMRHVDFTVASQSKENKITKTVIGFDGIRNEFNPNYENVWWKR